MKFLNSASGNSIWRGYDYFKENKVIMLTQTSNGFFTAKVKGSENKIYTVNIDIEHPKRSECDCPHANGQRVICKHKIATYFTAFPKDAEQFYNEAMAYEEEEEQLQDELVKYIHKLKKSQLEDALLELLFDGPEWQYDRFINEHLEGFDF